MALILGRRVQRSVDLTRPSGPSMLCPDVFLRWLTICDNGTSRHWSTGEKSGLVEAVMPSKEEPGEMEGEVCPETMGQLAPTESISPKEHLTSRKCVCVCVCVCVLVAQCVQLFVTPWTAAHQAPLSMEFSRQEYWRGLLTPSPGDHPDPGTEPQSPALQVDSSPSEPPGKPLETLYRMEINKWIFGSVVSRTNQLRFC